MGIQDIKNEWKHLFKTFSVGHQDWVANQIIAKLKGIGELQTANEVVMMTNPEIDRWLQGSEQ